MLSCALQFSVLRYESVIHEFDPYFNYRSTIKLVTEVGSTCVQLAQVAVLQHTTRVRMVQLAD
jgi:hypothetical protein